MNTSLRETLESLLGDIDSWGRLSSYVASEIVAPGALVRTLGEMVSDVLIIENGLFEVSAPGQPMRWATAGAVIGVAASLSGSMSSVGVVAARHGRLSRIPAKALWNHDADVHASMATVARLAQLPDHGLATLPPDPLIIAALFEGCDDALQHVITTQLASVVHAIGGARLVRIAATASLELSDELATHEADAKTIVYVLRDTNTTRAADVVAHADRVLVFQGTTLAPTHSLAYRVACDGTARRHTELVFVQGEQQPRGATTMQVDRPPNVRRIHLLAEPSPVRLEWLLTELREHAREHETLRQFEVLADLGGPELAWIQDTLRWERVDGGSVLLKQGDEANDAWLIRAGRLEVVRETPSGPRHVMWLGPGAFVGEAALLTGGRQLTSVRAVRDSTVARIDRATIETLLAQSPGFTRAIARVLGARAAGSTISSSARRARTFTILPLIGKNQVNSFVAEFAAACGDATVVTAERLNIALGVDASHTRRGDIGDGEIIAWLDQLEQRHDAVILVCDGALNPWTRRAIRQSDHILLVADATTTPELRAIERELADVGSASTSGQGPARHLVLLQNRGITEASGTSGWLAVRPNHAHHHVRTGDRSDLARLARRLTGRAIAVAFSGASSRAPAHFGVVRAMNDCGLPIDIVSGSSSGAGVAALVAMGISAEQGLAHAIRIITTGAPRIHQFQPPITALISGATANKSLQAVFGDRQLEDQLIPAVLMAVDIRRHRAVRLTRGPIWKLVRASGALPLLWPPVWHDGDLLVDGGIMDYLPIEVFGDQTDGGLVIASNLDATAGLGAPAFEGTLDYGTVMNSWRELGKRMLGSRAAKPPALIDILFHAMGIPSFQQQEGLAALAQRDNVRILTPPLGSFGLFDVTPEIGRALEIAAYEHARRELAGHPASAKRASGSAVP